MKNNRQFSKEEVRAILNEVDPAGLIQMGCPEDEYDPENEVLLEFLNSEEGLSMENLTSTFDYFFSPLLISRKKLEELHTKLNSI